MSKGTCHDLPNPKCIVIGVLGLDEKRGDICGGWRNSESFSCKRERHEAGDPSQEVGGAGERTCIGRRRRQARIIKSKRTASHKKVVHQERIMPPVGVEPPAGGYTGNTVEWACERDYSECIIINEERNSTQSVKRLQRRTSKSPHSRRKLHNESSQSGCLAKDGEGQLFAQRTKEHERTGNLASGESNHHGHQIESGNQGRVGQPWGTQKLDECRQYWTEIA
ncbi:hypothetical protein FB45DRAFT_876064 [Roridomyces roridus]|uniref:Uncharacterized protein n=1 Tax=Roridomyces roridus TaxID=1738132 RepID=A0AAD7FBW1_9AGAR|nr:hypothetical protein FB45DRAFT_876064 [Roridomyces roridus]